jgi:hypothetical protein
MSENQIPRSAKILREKNVGSFCPTILGTCIGHLIDCGLDDLEILTVVEELLKMRALINDPAMRAHVERMNSTVANHLKEGG